MTHYPAAGPSPMHPQPQHDPAVLRRRAATALSGAIVLWLLVGLMILAALARAGQSATGQGVSEPSSGAEALGRLVGTVGFPIAAALGAILLHRRRARLLRQARTIETASHHVHGVLPPGHTYPPQPYPAQPFPNGRMPPPSYGPPGHLPPTYPAPPQHHPGSR
ncbi:hypothetical protein [Gordonia tangerina]|uniref:Uncharacterized protein n=1 Tax=Gordonia tangerina TaxID=2911060 RepID=A0ABS9DND6_9ACTN|nr:hypothetical protein [Gordonia tangerina]MCF3940671.1 hypothetical protein [Gordonia tangerina]